MMIRRWSFLILSITLFFHHFNPFFYTVAAAQEEEEAEAEGEAEGYEYSYYGEEGYTYSYYDESEADESQPTTFQEKKVQLEEPMHKMEEQLPPPPPPPPPPKRGFDQIYTHGQISSIILTQKISPAAIDEVKLISNCLPKGDNKGSRATGTDEMELLSIIREKNAAKLAAEAATSNRKLTLQQIQEIKKQRREEEVAKKAKMIRKFQSGSDCESLICSGCKILVEEFAYQVQSAVSNPTIKDMTQVFGGFCNSKEISMRYNDVVTNLCNKHFTIAPGYKETLMYYFDIDSDYDNIGKIQSILPKREAICLTVGACVSQQFSFSAEQKYRYQERWDDKCTVCQTLADEIEERALLMRKISEGQASTLVAGSCDRLNLPGEYNEICRNITSKSQDDIAWIVKMHAETYMKKTKVSERFSDELCQEIKLCQKWIGEEELKEMQSMEEIVPVFA